MGGYASKSGNEKEKNAEIVKIKKRGMHYATDLANRNYLLQELLWGSDITTCTRGVCYDAAAYFMHLKHPDLISLTDLETISAQKWVPIFKEKFRSQKLWQGESLTEGNLLLFEIGGNDSHAAISIGGTCIRAINGSKLGAHWSKSIDLKHVLKERLPTGGYKYDGTEAKVWILSESFI